MFNKKQLTKRILDISYNHKLSHIGSVLSALPVIIDIYTQMDLDKDRFVLSSGHSGLALYVVLEALGYGDAEKMLEIAGIHPDRVINTHMDGDPIACSTGSLGQGLPIALGMSLADKGRDVYCLISDGECYEGSIWETLQMKDRLGVDNLKIYVNANGYSAYSKIDIGTLKMKLLMFDSTVRLYKTNSEPFPFLSPIGSHYHVMKEEDYYEAINILEGTV